MERDFDDDFKIHDRYVRFSAEVIRLAMLAPAAVAFLIGKPAAEHGAELTALTLCALKWALAFMTAAVLLGLAHRYLAIDLMQTLVENERKGLHSSKDWRFKASTYTIVLAPIFLAVGIASLFVALFSAFQR
jgi:hypothetical protein